MAHAARGTRKLDEETETLHDEGLRQALRRQAAKVYLESILAGVLLTLLCLALPA